MKGDILIDIRNLVKVYKGRINPAVDDLSLQINDGDIFGILGPNGAGKTTIISVLCNLISQTSGKIYIDGFSLSSDNRKIKELTGAVFQDIALYDKLTAFENLRYFGTLYGINRTPLEERINKLLLRLGLEKFKDEKVGTFSGGMKRRINLLAGLLHNPRLLFLDEPAVGIDVQSRNVILEFLHELNEAGTTIVYTSHMMEEAQKLCSKVAIIDYGKVIAVATPGELIHNNPDCHSLEEVFLKLTGRSLRDDYL
ncbi:MAG: ATP-binding cassette domain-containing protein [Bacteroidota bacterium]